MRPGSPGAGTAALMTCKTYEFSWNSPFGPVTLTVTDTKTFFSRHHVVDIGLPPDTPFPLETLSYVATGAEIERAGGAAGFVESLIATAESTAAWRDYAARLSRHGLPATRWPPGQAPRPRHRRRRLKFSAPRR